MLQKLKCYFNQVAIVTMSHRVTLLSSMHWFASLSTRIYFIFLHVLLSVPCSCLNKPQIGWVNGVWTYKRFAWIAHVMKSMKVINGSYMKSMKDHCPLLTSKLNFFPCKKKQPKNHLEKSHASENVQNINCLKKIMSCIISLPYQVLTS